MEWTSKQKTQFRSRVAWRRFREQIVKDNNKSCTCCGVKYVGKRTKMLELHHLCPDEYDVLEPERFALLCHGCHELCEIMYRRIKEHPERIPAKTYYFWEGILKSVYKNYY